MVDFKAMYDTTTNDCGDVHQPKNDDGRTYNTVAPLPTTVATSTNSTTMLTT